MSHSKKKIKGHWKMPWAVVASLLSINITACSHASLKNENEIWLIDEKEVILYRKIDGGKEQIIPIKDNKDMGKFLCVSTEQADEIIEAVIEGR